MTLPTRLVLETLLAAPHSELHGYELLKRTQLLSGTLYPLLVRLEQAGWVTSRWEEREEPGGRPRRRFYRLSADGAAEARDALRARPSLLRLQPGEDVP